ncbi:hypothetical protein Tco_0501958 [Tanacetum coccineum]
MLDYSKAEPIGRLLDVLCQVGVTTILANFMLLDVPVDRDMPIIVGRSFFYACGVIMNTMKGKMSTFDGFVYQQYDVVKVRSNHEESDSDDDEEYYMKRNEMGKPFYGPNRAKYLNCDDPMDRALALQDAINPFRKTVGTHDDEIDSSRPKRTRVTKIFEEAMLGRVHHEFLMWGTCNRAVKSAFDINEPVYTELFHEFYSTYDFDEEVTDEKLITKKLIKFWLGGRGHSLSLLEFARHLGLYNSAEVREEGCHTPS